MTTPTDQDSKQELPAYVAPQVWVMDTSSTKSGPDPDPTELPGFFTNMS